MPQLLDGKGSHLTAGLAGTRSCLPGHEHASPAGDASVLTLPKRVLARRRQVEGRDRGLF